MLWTSLRFGWGNTGPVILLCLLPLVTVTVAVERQPARPQMSAAVPAADASVVSRATIPVGQDVD